jgi:hypothetical protein
MEADRNPPRALSAGSLRWRMPSFVLLVSAATGMLGCSDQNSNPKPGPSESAARVFTGEVAGTDAQVSAIVTAHRARIYFCGGDSTYRTLTHWIPSAVVSGMNVTADDTAGFGLQASLDGDELAGSLATGDGGAYTFHASTIDGRTVAGLYEAVSACGKVGLIVSQASSKDDPAGQGACIGTTTVDIHQVNPVLPLVRAKNGTIRVVVDGSSAEVLVKAAAPPAD